MERLKKFDIQQFGPYRFIGKSVYARAGLQCGNNNFAGFLWNNSDWIFEKLDELKDYATEETHNAALLTWQCYNNEGISHYDIFCGSNCLLGYTVGRFMKPDTPVPDGMDYFDIPATIIAKGWFDKEIGEAENLVKNAVEQQGDYIAASWKFMVEVEAKDAFGYYIACDKKN